MEKIKEKSNELSKIVAKIGADKGYNKMSKKDLKKEVKKLQSKGWYDNYTRDMTTLQHFLSKTNENCKINEEQEDIILVRMADGSYDKVDTLLFTDRVDVSPEISLGDYGVLRNPSNGMTYLGTAGSNHGSYAAFDWTYINLDDVESALESVGEGFYDSIGSSAEEFKNSLSEDNLATAILDLNSYNGWFMPQSVVSDEIDVEDDKAIMYPEDMEVEERLDRDRVNAAYSKENLELLKQSSEIVAKKLEGTFDEIQPIRNDSQGDFAYYFLKDGELVANIETSYYSKLRFVKLKPVRIRITADSLEELEQKLSEKLDEKYNKEVKPTKKGAKMEKLLAENEKSYKIYAGYHELFFTDKELTRPYSLVEEVTTIDELYDLANDEYSDDFKLFEIDIAEEIYDMGFDELLEQGFNDMFRTVNGKPQYVEIEVDEYGDLIDWWFRSPGSEERIQESLDEISDEVVADTAYKRSQDRFKNLGNDEKRHKMQRNYDLISKRAKRQGKAKDDTQALKAYDRLLTKGFEKANPKYAKHESLIKSLLHEGKKTLTMNEGEASEMTTWNFTAKANVSKKLVETLNTAGCENIRCVITNIARGSVSGIAIADYYMSENEVKESVAKALSKNGLAKVNVTSVVNLY